MKKHILITTILSITLFSCLDDGPYDNCEEYYFSDLFKSYTFFKEGSYWVYEDTINNITDSVVLKTHNVTLNDYCNESQEYEELLYQNFYSSFFNKYYSNIFSRANASMYLYEGTFCIGMLNLYNTEDIMDSFEVNEVWYKDVRAETSEDFKYYWAKDIGLIKKEFKDSHNFGDTIFHFNIVKYQVSKE